MGGGGSRRSNAAASSAGLPFAGIPPEVADRVNAILRDEPDFDNLGIDFSYELPDEPTFTLWTFLAPYRMRLLGALALVGTAELMLLVGPYLVKIAIDDGIVPGNFQVLTYVALGYVAALVAGMLVSGIRIRYVGRLGQLLMYQLRLRVFSHLQRLSIDFYTEEKVGRLLTRMTSDIEALAQLLQTGLVNLAAQGLKLVFIIGILLSFNVELTMILIFAVAPVMLGLTIWFRRASARGYDRVRECIAAILTDLQESLAGMRLITFYNRRRHNVIHHRNIVCEHREANNYTARISGGYQAMTQLLETGSTVILIAVGYLILLDVNPDLDPDGAFTIGALIAFNNLLARFFQPIQQLVQLYNEFQSGNAAVIKLSDLLGTRPSVLEAPDAEAIVAMEGDIRLRNVTFSYEPGEEVLRGIDLHIPAGHSIALVGPTGAGKSTIAKLITRFYDPDDGEILIDGKDLRGLTLHSLHSQLGVVPQEPFLFHGSIRTNITFSKPDATEEEVMAACRAVGIDDLVERLPEGLDTPCHERGSSLSSGERQLLALARAFLSRPRVLVLDEATSSVDLKSESKIEMALDNLLEGRTAVIIAHRLQTAMRADAIAVVRDHGIAEMGTHEELLALGGYYAEMYDTWMTASSHEGNAAF